MADELNMWENSTARRGIGIRTRLIGLVVVPAVGLAGLSVQQVQDHRAVAREAGELAADVESAAVALDAFVVTTEEFRHSQTLVLAHAFGIPDEQLVTLLGYDPAEQLATARARVDANPLVPTLESRAGLANDLRAARAELDRNVTEGPAIAKLVVEAREVWTQEIESLGARRVEVGAAAELRRAIDGLQVVAELFELSSERIVVVANAIVPGSASELAGSDAGPRGVDAQYEAALRAVAEQADEHLRPAVDAVLANRQFEEAMEPLLAAENPLADIPAVAAMFRAGLEQDDTLRELVAAASDDARHHAVSVGAAAESRYTRTVVLVVGLLLGSVAIALAVARSIVRPLRRVALRAAAISGGDLDGDLLPEEGPREAGVLARSLNDSVINLRAVARRMSALAAGDLDAARQATSGELGALVGRSVDGLANSLAERDRLQHQLAHEAAHDALTGLANRRTAMHRLNSLLQAGSTVAVLFIDLDGFKNVNDEFGHAVGDRVLVAAARRLMEVAAEDVLVARLGGDEFIVGTIAASEDTVLDLADRVVLVFDRPVSIDGVPHRIGASVGVAFSLPGDDADHLLRSADNALYAAKEGGRGALVVLDAELRARLEQRHRIESDLRVAIHTNALELHYQPVYEAGGRIHGVEALVRWRLDDGTLIPPDDFIPVAERSGLIVEVDRWVMRRGLQQLADWQGTPLGDLRLSVNVSAPTMLSPTFVEGVKDSLAHAGMSGEVLVIEVTETALLHDLETAANHIAALLELGVRTSVDDFGTGYTSVAHLRRLPVSEVKIDRSFVHAMGVDERDRVLVDLITRIGTALDLDVVAEGVETHEQLDALWLLGCRYAQGFLLGRPVPPDELPAMFAAAAGVSAGERRRLGRHARVLKAHADSSASAARSAWSSPAMSARWLAAVSGTSAATAPARATTSPRRSWRRWRCSAERSAASQMACTDSSWRSSDSTAARRSVVSRPSSSAWARTRRASFMRRVTESGSRSPSVATFMSVRWAASNTNRTAAWTSGRRASRRSRIGPSGVRDTMAS
ncbi:MAG: putative bifunctional diguanylate cyclase/phosphodiesterase [Acidimicrobiia bacterium]